MLRITKIINKNRLLNVFLILSAALFIPPMFAGIINAGNIAAVILSAAVFLICKYFHVIKNTKGLFITFMILTPLFLLGLAYAAFLSVNMIITASQKPQASPEKERTVIVLGCMVKGDAPSAMLERRLMAARDYLLADENAVCVVTGGLGENKTHTEAEVMRAWFIKNNIS